MSKITTKSPIDDSPLTLKAQLGGSLQGESSLGEGLKATGPN